MCDLRTKTEQEVKYHLLETHLKEHLTETLSNSDVEESNPCTSTGDTDFDKNRKEREAVVNNISCDKSIEENGDHHVISSKMPSADGATSADSHLMLRKNDIECNSNVISESFVSSSQMFRRTIARCKEADSDLICPFSDMCCFDTNTTQRLRHHINEAHKDCNIPKFGCIFPPCNFERTESLKQFSTHLRQNHAEEVKAALKCRREKEKRKIVMKLPEQDGNLSTTREELNVECDTSQNGGDNILSNNKHTPESKSLEQYVGNLEEEDEEAILIDENSTTSRCYEILPNVINQNNTTTDTCEIPSAPQKKPSKEDCMIDGDTQCLDSPAPSSVTNHHKYSNTLSYCSHSYKSSHEIQLKDDRLLSKDRYVEGTSSGDKAQNKWICKVCSNQYKTYPTLIEHIKSCNHSGFLYQGLLSGLVIETQINNAPLEYKFNLCNNTTANTADKSEHNSPTHLPPFTTIENTINETTDVPHKKLKCNVTDDTSSGSSSSQFRKDEGNHSETQTISRNDQDISGHNEMSPSVMCQANNLSTENDTGQAGQYSQNYLSDNNVDTLIDIQLVTNNDAIIDDEFTFKQKAIEVALKHIDGDITPPRINFVGALDSEQPTLQTKVNKILATMIQYKSIDKSQDILITDSDKIEDAEGMADPTLLFHENEEITAQSKTPLQDNNICKVQGTQQAKSFPVLPLYQCEICNKILANRRGLKQHKKSIHSGIVYSCNACDYSTRYRSQLNRHELKHTPT